MSDAWRSGVHHEDHVNATLYVQIGRRTGDGHEVVIELGGAGHATTVRFPEGISARPDELLAIPVDIARALHDALARHFGGTFESHQLRKDYDHERSRVDRLIGAVIERTSARSEVSGG